MWGRKTKTNRDTVYENLGACKEKELNDLLQRDRPDDFDELVERCNDEQAVVGASKSGNSSVGVGSVLSLENNDGTVSGDKSADSKCAIFKKYAEMFNAKNRGAIERGDVFALDFKESIWHGPDGTEYGCRLWKGVFNTEQ